MCYEDATSCSCFFVGSSCYPSAASLVHDLTWGSCWQPVGEAQRFPSQCFEEVASWRAGGSGCGWSAHCCRVGPMGFFREKPPKPNDGYDVPSTSGRMITDILGKFCFATSAEDEVIIPQKMVILARESSPRCLCLSNSGLGLIVIFFYLYTFGPQNTIKKNSHRPPQTWFINR